jgi:hypothetical protein
MAQLAVSQPGQEKILPERIRGRLSQRVARRQVRRTTGVEAQDLTSCRRGRSISNMHHETNSTEHGWLPLHLSSSTPHAMCTRDTNKAERPGPRNP